jgi:D-inositol-3-phosphate glycosyltransferase
MKQPRTYRILMMDALVGNDYSMELCRHLHDIGVDITLVTTADRPVPAPVDYPVRAWAPSKDPAKGKGGKILDYLIFLSRMANAAITRKYDLIHFQFFRFERPEALLLAFLRFTGVKVVHTAHNVFPHERKFGDYAVKAIIYRSASRIIIHSETVKQRLVDSFGINGLKTAVVPHGNFDTPEADSSPREEARRRLGIAPEDQVLLFFGFIRPYKGLDILLSAFDIVVAEHPSLRLLIAGKCQTPEMESQYRRQIKEMSSKERVLFHSGFVERSDMPVYFNASDWVVLPYRHIDHSGIIHLAYAYGRPVIATNVQGLSDMIKEDGTGYAAEGMDAFGLAEAFRKAVSDPDAGKRMGHRGYELGKTKYSWSAAAEKTRQLYENLLFNRPDHGAV